MPDLLTGTYGTAARVSLENFPGPLAGLDMWVITAPKWHPLWSQYALSVIMLSDVPGFPPAIKQRPDVTHELLVFALDPRHGPYDAAQVGPGSLYPLQPINISEQFTATDEQARSLAELCARAVVDGRLCPETAESPDRIRTVWRQSIHLTLDHDRDPHHGRAN